MKKIGCYLLILLCINCTSNTKKGTFEVAQKKTSVDSINGIPQGTFEYELYFSEHGGRMKNRLCIVKILGTSITVLQKEGETNLTGGSIIAKGTLLKHISGNWIIAKTEADAKVEEYGGCTGGPIPIDFSKRLIEWC